MSTDALIDGLWGEEPPPTAAAALQTHMAKLRQALASVGGDQSVETRPPGYIICLDDDALDLAEFQALAERGRATSDAAVAAAMFRRALGVWRGAPLADLAYEPFALAAITRLEEERLAVLEDRIEADLERGAHAEIIGELRELVAQHPLRERMWGQLMVALYRAGRQADALAAYRQARDVLLEELGLEPSSDLRGLEQAILEQSPSLDVRARTATLPRRGSNTTVLGERDHASVAALLIDDDRIDIGSRCSIGRRDDNDVVLDDGKVSREHALIRATPDGFVVTDLRSTNGTTVNGEPVHERLLVHGDRIGIGAAEIVFLADAQPA